LVNYPLGCTPRNLVSYDTKSRLPRVAKVVHPCRVKYFQKTMTTITDDLGMDVLILNNFKLILKLENNVFIGCFL
jgi:hypothetical protein